MKHRPVQAFIWLMILAGCAADETRPGAGYRGGAGTSGTSSAQPSASGTSAGASLSGNQPKVAGAPGAGVVVNNMPPVDPEDGCAATSVTAPPPSSSKVDILWVVDASGSMLDEQIKIGKNLSQFADKIIMANLDVHIVMMTTSAAIPVICPVTSPDPMAGTALAGSPNYQFLDSRVDSNNALESVLSNYPMYSSFLRSDAATHVVVVTDDESHYKQLGTATERAAAFYVDMKQLLGGRDFIQHTISSAGPSACTDPMCMPDTSTGICAFVMLGCGAAAPGDTYYELAKTTNGLTASICESDWTMIFDRLSQAVISSAPLPCNFTIPPPPAGETLDPFRVNVGYTAPGASAQTLFGRATEQTACADELGWYYDSPTSPTQINLCPAACASVGAGGGTVSIAFGCDTVELF